MNDGELVKVYFSPSLSVSDAVDDPAWGVVWDFVEAPVSWASVWDATGDAVDAETE